MMPRPTVTRRRVLASAVLLVGVAGTPPSVAQTQTDDTPGARFIAQTAERLTAIVNGPGTIDSKKPAMQAIIDQTVDVTGIARFCLGRYWPQATEAQRTQYVALFHDVLVRSITGHLGEYQGVTITLGRVRPREDGEAIDSVVERPNNPPANVTWLVSAGAAPKIIDVIAEGTSLRLTQRQDYASYLAHNAGDISKLLEALHQQATAG